MTVDTAPLVLALTAGAVAALNPCGFAFLPGCLGLVVAGSGQNASKRAAATRALAATVAMAAGFVTVFGLFGVVAVPLLASVQRYLPYATTVIGLLLVALGIWLLAGKGITVMLPGAGGVPTAHLRSMYGYGISYAVASLSCTIGPFLAVVGASFRRGSILNGVLTFIAYALGMAFTVGVVAVLVALIGNSAAVALRRVLPHVGRIAGGLLLVAGIYVTYYGYYEVRLLTLGEEGALNDPIVGYGVQVSTWLSNVVDSILGWLKG